MKKKIKKIIDKEFYIVSFLTLVDKPECGYFAVSRKDLANYADRKDVIVLKMKDAEEVDVKLMITPASTLTPTKQ